MDYFYILKDIGPVGIVGAAVVCYLFYKGLTHKTKDGGSGNNNGGNKES